MNRAIPWVLFLLTPFLLASCAKGINSKTGRGPTSASHTPAEISSSAQVVKVTSSPVTIPQNGSADAVVTLSISPGFHVNANPATFPYLIATEVKAGKVEGITVGTPSYPAAEKKKFQFAEQPLAVYEGETRVTLSLRAEKKPSVGPRSLPIAVRVQACDHEQCFPPATVNVTIAVDVQ
jgi:Disulphide bond corrector protein DsbC